ncbi:hypothetical protein ACFWC9_29140 [Streptomyces goshikiensis]|uniref:hypothetical protein n=1 Tax=Streptomyces goshikiensis TaxID=1942 RepID=UPI00369FBAA8
MSHPDAAYAWLPDHQLHVTHTLAHVDHTIDQALRLIYAYSEQGPLTLGEVEEGDRSHVVVKAIAPLPAAIPRLVADALTQLRAALEHTVYAEVESLLGRPLTKEEAPRIEVPATATERDFDQWLRGRRRADIPPLVAGQPLVERLRRLQPFQQTDSDDHPLRVLAMHTNLAKHRMPALAATRVGAVYPDTPDQGVEVAIAPDPGAGRTIALAQGSVLATVPRGERIFLNVVPTVALQRPHTDAWVVAAAELGALEKWVRTVAIPTLVSGAADVSNLPPQLDITTGHHDARQALLGAGRVPAADRATARISAAVARASLVDLLAPLPDSPGRDVLHAWIASLDDAQVLERMRRLAAGQVVALVGILAEAHQFAVAQGPGSRSTAGGR